jgi:hypothetical protein
MFMNLPGIQMSTIQRWQPSLNKILPLRRFEAEEADIDREI